MKLAVFGGTGRVGSSVVKLALSKKMQVKVLIRDRKKAEEMIPEAEHVIGDVTREEDISATLESCDMVFSGLSTDKTDTLSTAFPKIISEMEKQQISRIVTIGTAGILNSRYEQGKYRFETDESKRRKTFAAKEHVKVYQLLSGSHLDWTIVCPTYLPDGDQHTNLRYEIDLLPEGGKKITVEDTAQFAFEELIHKRFLHHRVGICY
ncbi:NAD(P)-dependent oxidoreductase [Halobacillus litoralis]|uniref:NAD(P)-binding domain-containing protein n=1 Tax=Halobacillus litoralis TaxID=45668 RepID=A0A410MAI3_9BACI|nr:NAD(P)H-binding protein [Halobacillus litoralis]QAS51725.1 hypothetical protein HLI_05500 [Halobacillus litoralis]